jgi:hypothetical protein
VNEVQRHWRSLELYHQHVYQLQGYKLQADRTVQNVKMDILGDSKLNRQNVWTMLQAFTQSLRRYVRYCSHETGVSVTSPHHTLQSAK